MLTAEAEWRPLSACRGINPKVFVPEDTGDRKKTDAAHQAALVFCARCPVVQECLEWSLAIGENWGVYGNTTPRQRRTIREQRQRAGSILT